MKINSFKKHKNGQYKVFLDDKEILLHEDLILANNLLVSKKITDKQLQKLERENKKYLLYDEALKYLKTRLRSKEEMNKQLKNKGYNNDEITNVIKILEKQGYINDRVYTEAYINDKIHFTNWGPYKIKSELLKNNISPKLIEEFLSKFDMQLEDERIKKIITKSIKTNRNKSISNLKRKVIMELNNLGYTFSYIQACLYLFDNIDDIEIKKKEYDKLYNKLSKKYSGYELEMRIKQKMYEKGFTK